MLFFFHYSFANQNLSTLVKQGVELKRFCKDYKLDVKNQYMRWYEQDQVRQTIASNLQYLLINQSIKDMAEISKKNQINDTDFNRLANALVDQSCSSRLTAIRPSEIKAKFRDIYQSSQASPLDVTKDNLGVVVNRFKQACSWDGKTDNYRLLSWFLADHFTYAWLISKHKEMDESVYCHDQLCKVVGREKFVETYPLAAGSLGWEDDWRGAYCSYFKYTVHDPRDQPDLIQKWMLDFFPHKVLYISNLLSHAANEPLKLSEGGILNWDHLLSQYNSKVEVDWKSKSEKNLQSIAGFMSHEEPLVLVPVDFSATKEIIVEDKLDIDIMVTAGEVDKSMGVENKVTVEFSINFPESFFYWTKRSFSEISPEETIEYQNLRKKLKKYYVKQLSEKKELFTRAPWEEQLPELLVDVSAKKILQATLKSSSVSFVNKWAQINIKLHFGLFALKHLYEMGPEFGRTSQGIDFTQPQR